METIKTIAEKIIYHGAAIKQWAIDIEKSYIKKEDVLGLNKEVFAYHNKQPATDEFSKGFEHACKVIEKELKKRITGVNKHD